MTSTEDQFYKSVIATQQETIETLLRLTEMQAQIINNYDKEQQL